MPPRKKAKGSVRAPSTPAGDEDSMAVDMPQTDTTEASSKPAYDILKDPWTDEQETSLFKGIIRWKPAGIHKHFRMIAISEHLRNHGYDPTIEQHTRIPGIWEKIRTMYDLDIIDDRENYFDEEQYLDFNLPEDEFDELMFMKGQRRPEADNASEAPSSPPQLGRASSPPGTKKRKRGDASTAKTKTRADTIDDTDEARTSPANSPPKSIRNGRSTNRSIGRLKGGSTSRQQSKDTSATVDTADEDEGGEETEEVAEEDEDAEEEDGTASPKPSKASKAKADPPTRKSRRKK